MRRALAVLVSVIAVGSLAACSSSQASEDGYRAGQTHQPYRVPSTPLTDTDGRPYSLTKDTDKPLTLVFFGYSHCPDICQTVMSNLTSAITRLDDADRERVDVVFVTTDPTRDTPAALRAYLDRFDRSFIGLTGDLDTITQVGKPLAVYVADGEKLPTGGRDLNSHSTQVTGITADDTSPILWTQDTSSADFAADIHTLLND
ncbi:SCO family protein [Nocardioides aquiterrae]|uniref:SCO family protein n=1 Tax=Nocardioides aquiterrae TaxID=203799 RepID=UPI0031D24763